ncbi:TolC family outer membrane protein [Agitococcus lubricus]|uniref:Outer membrane protein n=1 Tax=Agitococcus lubricus TaxID=1077255 RepID=A0A2T5J0T9_9GAMM|nr:TolC family outer membrane protein [Agitococcus lubricus]PTQ90001.1 outer membrane protein [Agitococcus lubricus]
MRSFVLPALMLTAFAAPAYALDLAQAYELALKNDPQWSATTNQYLAENQKESISRGALLPTVGFSASLNRNNISPELSDSFDYTGQQYALQVRQPLYRADLWNAYQKSKSLTSVNEANYQQKQQEQVLRVSEAYFNVLRAQETLAAAKAEEAALKRQLEQAQKRFDVGLIAKTDVLEAQAQLDGSTAGRISQEVNLSSAREALSAIIGNDNSTLSSLRSDFIVTPPQPNNPDDWVKLAHEKNPQLAAARFNYAAAEDVIREQQAGYLPTVDFVGSFAKVDNGSDNSRSFNNADQVTAGIELQWSLYAGGRTQNAIKQAHYARDASKDQISAIERQLTTLARTSFLTASADSYRVTARQQAMKSAEAALAATKAGYDVGTRNIVDVLLAERNVYAAKRDYANSRYDYVINTIKLRASAGQLSEVDIKELNGWLGQ